MVVFIKKNLYFLSPILSPILDPILSPIVGPVQGPVHVLYYASLSDKIRQRDAIKTTRTFAYKDLQQLKRQRGIEVPWTLKVGLYFFNNNHAVLTHITLKARGRFKTVKLKTI